MAAASPELLTAGPLDGIPRVRHAFFTRAGGVSDGLYASLNVGYGSDDAPEKVRENRNRALKALNPATAINTVHQVHGRDVAVATAAWEPSAAPQADAMVTAQPGLALGILTADCAPVLFADAEGGVIGAAHAGWRGAVGGVIAATVGAMERLGADRKRLRAAVGPSIARDSYEVGPEFPAPFLAEDPDNSRFFHPSAREGRYMFDLPRYIASRLDALGIGAHAALHRDTCAEESHFFSYRRTTLRSEPDYGRGLSAIVLES